MLSYISWVHWVVWAMLADMEKKDESGALHKLS